MGGKEGFTEGSSWEEVPEDYRDYAHREVSSEAPVDNPDWHDSHLVEPMPEGAEIFHSTDPTAVDTLLPGTADRVLGIVDPSEIKRPESQ
jgi:hypothetical protein